MHRPLTAALVFCWCGFAFAEELLKPVGGGGAGPVIDGLQATIRAVKEDFGPGESILIHWHIGNREPVQKRVKLDRDPRFPGRYAFEIVREGQTVNAQLVFVDSTEVEKTLHGDGRIDSWIDLRALKWADPSWLERRGEYEIVVNYLGTPSGKELPSGKATFRIVSAGTSTFPKLEPELAGRIGQLIAQLGADDYAVREEAQKKLLEIGVKALGPLVEALTAARDPEIRLRCQQLIDRLRQGPVPVPAAEALCERCRETAFTADIGQCRRCRNHTPSGGWIYCPDCARRLNCCAACGSTLRVSWPVPPRLPEPVPPPPDF